MSVPRYAARADSNSPALVEYARLQGMVVIPIREPVDYLAGCGGRWVPVEVKTPEKRGKANEFTKQQRDFFALIGPHGLPHWVWYDFDSVRECLRSLTPENSR